MSLIFEKGDSTCIADWVLICLFDLLWLCILYKFSFDFELGVLYDFEEDEDNMSSTYGIPSGVNVAIKTFEVIALDVVHTLSI